jgi:hypothetical protein
MGEAILLIHAGLFAVCSRGRQGRFCSYMDGVATISINAEGPLEAIKANFHKDRKWTDTLAVRADLMRSYRETFLLELRFCVA